MTDQSPQYQDEITRLILEFFPNAVEVGTWTPQPAANYLCQDCKYYESDGSWFPNYDDTDDLFWCSWCVEHGKSPLGKDWDDFEEDSWEFAINSKYPSLWEGQL